MSETKTTAMARGYAIELKDLAASLYESIDEAKSPKEAWDMVDKFHADVAALRKSVLETSVSTEDMEGHTRHLQGLDMPIMVNSICDHNENYIPSEVSEMHVGKVDGVDTLLITPEVISMP